MALVLTITGAGWAGETAVFTSGARLHVDRHEIQDTKIRLFIGSGYIEMNAVEVASLEADEPTPPTAVVPAAAPTVPAGTPAAAPTTAAAAAVPPPLSPVDLADAAADKYGLPRKLVRSVMRVESGFQPDAVSPKGAVGLMQLMPDTARLLGADAQDPVQNVDAGARYLRQLLLKYDGLLWHALAAYNAGTGAVQKYGGIPPYSDTINYINRIDREMKR